MKDAASATAAQEDGCCFICPRCVSLFTSLACLFSQLHRFIWFASYSLISAVYFLLSFSRLCDLRVYFARFLYSFRFGFSPLSRGFTNNDADQRWQKDGGRLEALKKRMNVQITNKRKKKIRKERKLFLVFRPLRDAQLLSLLSASLTSLSMVFLLVILQTLSSLFPLKFFGLLVLYLLLAKDSFVICDGYWW